MGLVLAGGTAPGAAVQPFAGDVENFERHLAQGDERMVRFNWTVKK